MFNKYYQDELAFLREMGKEFSQAHPALAHMLAERGERAVTRTWLPSTIVVIALAVAAAFVLRAWISDRMAP